MTTADVCVYLTAAYPENIWMALLKPYGLMLNLSSWRGPGAKPPEVEEFLNKITEKSKENHESLIFNWWVQN